MNNIMDLKNCNINFVNDNNIKSFIFYHTEKDYYCISKLTNWISTKIKLIKSSSKYYSLVNIDNGYYIGDIEESIYYNMKAKLFKLTIKEKWYSINNNKYIIMIVENPNINKKLNKKLNNEQYKETYKVIIYKIFKYGTYTRKLHPVYNYTSRE